MKYDIKYIENKLSFPIDPRECPRCHSNICRVYDTRTKTNGRIVRRRLCLTCYEKWYSEEVSQGIVGEEVGLKKMYKYDICFERNDGFQKHEIVEAPNISWAIDLAKRLHSEYYWWEVVSAEKVEDSNKNEDIRDE